MLGNCRTINRSDAATVEKTVNMAGLAQSDAPSREAKNQFLTRPISWQTSTAPK
jgi:hypothetical protein